MSVGAIPIVYLQLPAGYTAEVSPDATTEQRSCYTDKPVSETTTANYLMTLKGLQGLAGYRNW